MDNLTFDGELYPFSHVTKIFGRRAKGLLILREMTSSNHLDYKTLEIRYWNEHNYFGEPTSLFDFIDIKSLVLKTVLRSTDQDLVREEFYGHIHSLELRMVASAVSGLSDPTRSIFAVKENDSFFKQIFKDKTLDWVNNQLITINPTKE